MQETILFPVPQGFRTFVTNLGIRDTTDDFSCVISEVPCTAAGVFTQSRFVGPSVTISRKHIENAQAQAIITISKNANVANGAAGLADAQEVIALISAETGIAPDNILLASTGVIGHRYPMENIRKGLSNIKHQFLPADFSAVARAIMTTDTVSKLFVRQVGKATLVGMAKGVGMIEPNMATLLTYFFTDAAIPSDQLRPMFRTVIDKTFNCLSIDTDTSTSDTAIILANSLAGEVNEEEFTHALEDIARNLVYMIARDGEGSTKVIEVTVDQAATYAQAKRVAKAIVNSPLVKTAIHGADPNWGRVAMAIGKCSDDIDIDQQQVVIRFGNLQVYPSEPKPDILDRLKAIMADEKVGIHVSLNTGKASATVWGCALSEGYVKLNSQYST